MMQGCHILFQKRFGVLQTGCFHGGKEERHDNGLKRTEGAYQIKGLPYIFFIHLQNTDGAIADKYKIVGSYPERMSGVQLDMASEEPIKYTITFSYDRWEVA